MHARILVAALSAAALTGSAAAARADLVVNGGFESGDFSDWTTVAASSGSIFQVDPSDPRSGTYQVLFGAVSDIPDEIFQVVATTAGSTYDIEFWVKNQISDDSDFLQVLWEGTALLSDTSLPVADDDAYHQFVFQVTAGSSGSELRFQSFDAGGFMLLDDVSVALAAAAVPEPGTSALFGLGAAGLGGLVWRRRRPRAAAK